jgi:hypothetical protein
VGPALPVGGGRRVPCRRRRCWNTSGGGQRHCPLARAGYWRRCHCCAIDDLLVARGGLLPADERLGGAVNRPVPPGALIEREQALQTSDQVGPVPGLPGEDEGGTAGLATSTHSTGTRSSVQVGH